MFGSHFKDKSLMFNEQMKEKKVLQCISMNKYRQQTVTHNRIQEQIKIWLMFCHKCWFTASVNGGYECMRRIRNSEDFNGGLMTFERFLPDQKDLTKLDSLGLFCTKFTDRQMYIVQ